ncbi:MAG TPA: hypothetical protein VI039_08270 [Solirubrobacterales bacterium]
MNKRLLLAALAALAVAVASLAASAGAEKAPPIVVGDACEANAVVPNRTLLANELSSSGLRNIPQVSEGDVVITRWGVRRAPGLSAIPQRLEIYAPQGEGEYRKVAESETKTVSDGSSSFNSRIVLDGGESIGLFGPGGTYACQEEGETSLGADGAAAVGETRSFTTESGIGSPVYAVVEIDYDKDGYGDETQDRCYGEASKDSDCPIGVSVTAVTVNRRAILLEITPKAWARIKVRGEYLWREPSKRPGEEGRLVGTDRDTHRKVAGANEPRTFRVPLPGKVLRRLNRLSPAQSMVARMEIYITDRDGWKSEKRMRIAIWGRR